MVEDGEKPSKATPSAEFSWFALELIAGGGAAAISKSLVAPLARIKLLMQLNQEPRSIRGMLSSVVREEGLLGLFRGNGANVMRVVASSGLHFLYYDIISHVTAPTFDVVPPSRRVQTASRRQGRRDDGAAFLHRLTSATLSSMSTLITLYPLDLARTRLAADVYLTKGHRTYTGIGDCLQRTVVSEGGPLALFKGLNVALVGLVPLVFFSISSYEIYSRYLLPERQPTWWYPLAQCSVAAAASLTAQSIVYPLDTLRRHRQIHGAFQSVNIGHFSWKRSYAGFIPNAAKTLPQAITQLLVYDILRSTAF